MNETRAELARFLRSRREQMSPTDAGLPPGRRRRTRGLRREEVAVLAGVSPTWYTYLEQGRDIHPSDEVLDSLSRVLQLDDDERAYIHRLASGRPPPVSRASVEHDSTLVREVVDGWAVDGYPVYAANHYGDMVAWNDATVRWYADFAGRPENERNMLWWIFTDPVARERFVDWEDEASDLVARLRATHAARMWDPRYTDLVETLGERSAEFVRMWHELTVRELRTRERRMVVPGHGVRVVKLVVLRMVDDFSHGIVLHLPVEA